MHELHATLAMASIPILVITLAIVRTGAGIPPKWRARYRHWESRPFFWAQYGRLHAKSARISDRQRRIVYAADRHRCVIRSKSCHGPLQVDHIRPWTSGGRTKLFNLMTLCRYHNVTIKNTYWPGVFYRGSNIVLATAVLRKEQRARCNPLRWARALLAALLS